MNNYKANRFIIDKIDRRLGSIDKELKFDKIMILVGLVVAIAPVILLHFTAERVPELSVIWLLLSMFGMVMAITMSKEYISDLKRTK